MSITIKEVEHVAKLARIELKDRPLQDKPLQDKQKKSFTEQLARILDYIKQLEKVDTTSIEPVAQPIPLNNVFREDVVKKSGKEDALLRIAPEREDRFFKVQKVIE